MNRLENGLRRPRKAILGLDIAGRIESLGKGAPRFKPGDEVYGDISGTWGGFAEYVCVPESKLTLKPTRISFLDAAATSHAANLVVQGLVDLGGIQPGDRILINGAGGGVGTFAFQIAKLYGAEVTGVDSGGKLDLMRSLVCRPSTRVVVLKPNKDSAYINRLFEEGRLKPVIDGPYPLEELPTQMRRFGEGTYRGKIVIAMA